MVQHDNKVHRYNGRSIEIGVREDSAEVMVERRNPYLLDYEEERRNQVRSQRKAGNGSSSSARGREVYERRSVAGYGEGVNRRGESFVRREATGYEETVNVRSAAGNRKPSSRQITTGYAQIPNRRTRAGYAPSANCRVAVGHAGNSNHSAAARRIARYRRRKRVMMQRIAVSIWVMCLLCLAVTLLVRNNRVSAADRNPKGDAVVNSAENVPPKQLDAVQPDTVLVQGIPATEFAKHPEWTEDFLTPNEYSRPGDALESVTNIFVHYTANAGTSAAQNRSYFERQKDEHLASVSAHFIIGYEGEIIQCVPLDEIAYAVKSRNFDSISIECCHLEKDGSFTQETYDSLIALLKWLLEVYDLESEDILRHYDCGGKKCPLYFMEHPDAWEELKKDVDKL